MAYYWTPDSGLPFSDEFKEQTAEWRSELEAITERIAPQDFLKTLADNISTGGSIFFRDAFYEFISSQSDQTMIIRTTLSKLVMCSDLSFLLKISYEMNKGGNIPTLAHFAIAMFSFDRYIYYYFYRVPYNNAKEEQG